ncbi:MAG: hypothetical protein C5S33_04860 [ANME-2 cluster archaeon]|nr:hypothetical protein [ANME-2 cluster archaeon]
MLCFHGVSIWTCSAAWWCEDMFDRKYLKNEIDKLDGVLTEHIKLYLIGGGSMSFQNLKDATKDIDVVVRSENDMNLLKSALAQMGYSVPAIRGPYKQMQASAIMENKDGFRWDIFVNVVCGGLKLSDAMADRATNLFSMDRVSINMISLEDIFIFKSITSRERDREDMYLLFLQGLDFNQIRDEITWQNDNNMSAAWVAFFFNGLEEVVERYSIVIPFFDEFHDTAYSDMLSQMILDRLESGSATVEDLNRNFGVDDIEKHVESMIQKKLVTKNSDGSFSLNRD